ncbi:unnamed protein product, partial [Mesorhabditis belari]|uniref:Protein SDA1 n=1 Tax=Mesorhabditis belari TaxID=2138241 RepID=A0AAF3EL35_9BILA
MTATALPMMPPAVSGKKSRFVMSESNLGLMQEIVRKDPESYKEEFNEQLYFYTQTMKLLQLQPAMHKLEVQSLLDTIIFLAGVAQFYPTEAKEFSAHLQTILREQAPGLDAEVRMQFCKALVCLRNKNMVEPLEITELFFELTKVEDKRLRKFIITSIGAHLKRLYLKKNAKALSKLQNFCLTKLKDSRSIIARVAQLILIDAFRKQYWRDAKTANAIAECCFHKLPKMQVTAMKFFLGSKEDEEGIEVDSEDDEEAAEKDAEQKTLKDIMQSYRNAKKTKKRTKDFEKAKKMLSKKRKSKKGRSKECNLLAIQLLYDPQALSDRLFGMLEQKKIDKFEIRLFRIALIARLAGIHKLQTLGFYSYLHRYMQPRQRDVTRILLYAAQACHDLVPPDTIEQLLRCIAQEFITDRNSPEAITVGINAIREILANCPFAATEELMRDLAEYKQYKNKNVSMAARGLVALCRTLNPKLLKKKDRGRPVDGKDETAEEYRAYAAPIVRDFVPGAECLDDEQLIDEDEEKSGSGSDEEEEWEDYSESEESEEIEGDDDEEEEGDEEVEEIDDDDEELEFDEEDGEDEEVSDEEGDEDDEREIEAASPSPSTTLSTSTNAAEKAATISNDRILTQAEFKKIRQWQIKKHILGSKRLARGGKKREHLTNDDRLIEEEVLQTFQTRDTSDGLPRLNAIEHFHKKKKETKAERLERVEEGREGREDYGKKKKNGPHVGRTNRELAKKKVFQMVRAKKRGQNRQRSFRDQQKSLRNYLLRQSGRKPGNM